MSDEIELSLGLSLNGRFGVDPKSKNRSLERWASVGPGFPEVSREGHVMGGIGRTSSMPVEVEEETRKRKEFELERKTSVKQRVVGIENAGRVGHSGRGFGSMGRIFEDIELCREIPSPGTRSTETKSPQSVFSFTEKTEYHPTKHPTTMKKSGTKPSQTSTESKQSVMSGLKPQQSVQDIANMPYVCTKPNGPNGKRVEGFLYGYRKGEEVRIICVCHGTSLSPAEFIKHAGGGDVEHPLRHIVVSPSPCSSLPRSRESLGMSKTF